ncbi:hypothetical protein C8Q70DRAFT_539127 [Cubamyces menziesii]|nr:hypothetical protein C8Q70DRAFT_539127 [Cubamyces menziesii]
MRTATMGEVHPMFAPGACIILTAADGRTLTFTIDRPFAPFTKSVVLLARCPELAPDTDTPSQAVVIKIYDPRFLDDRISAVPSQPSRPWTLAAERAATALPPDALDASSSQLWDDEPAESDAAGQAARAALWEEHFRRLSFGCFDAERGAYDRLRAFQGGALPRMLVAGTWQPPDERGIRPPAVVLEYIADAVSLRDVEGDALQEQPEVCAALVRAVDGFAERGVFHGDLHRENVLFTPRGRPERGVVIDFGCAGVRADDEDEESWRFNVSFANDGGRVRRLLREKGVVLPEDVADPAPAA